MRYLSMNEKQVKEHAAKLKELSLKSAEVRANTYIKETTYPGEYDSLVKLIAEVRKEALKEAAEEVKSVALTINHYEVAKYYLEAVELIEDL
jgi:hypothetical protein